MEHEQKLIAVIDDDVHIGNMLEELLVREGFAVLRAYSGTEALLLLSGRRRPDLVLLDLMLPGLSGEEVLPHLAGIPVIVLSARAGVDDKVELLLGGAADYLTKPFDTRELLARIAVQLRGAAPAAPALRCRGLVLDTAARAVSAGGEAVRLTHGIRHSEAADAKPPAGGDQVPAAGPDQPGHPRLRGELPEGPRQQSQEEAPGRRGGGCD